MRVDDDEQYGLIEKDQSTHLKLFSEAKEHTIEEVKRENGANTTEQSRPSPLRSEKKGPENTFKWMSRSPGWSWRKNSSARQLSTQTMELGSAPR